MKAILVWLAVVSVLFVMPRGAVDPPVYWSDKLFHVVVYAVTSVLFYTVLRSRTGAAVAAGISFVLAMAYGLAVEVAQGALGTGVFSGWDLGADAVGALGGTVFALIRIKPGRQAENTVCPAEGGNANG